MFNHLIRISIALLFLLGPFQGTAVSWDSLKNNTFEGLHGRVVRGNSPHHFEYLSYDTSRKLVFLLGSDSLERLKGKSGYEILMLLGYTQDYIQRILNDDHVFKLIVFPAGEEAKLATWENVLALAAEAYPEVGADLLRHQRSLETVEFELYEQAAGYRFADVEKGGIADERYMTYERYLRSSRGLLETRAFLYFAIRLNELFSGDGYTYDYTGNRCLREYIAFNRAVKELDGLILELDIVFAYTL